MPEKSKPARATNWAPIVIIGAAAAAAGGIYLILNRPKSKKPGDEIFARISFSHVGGGGLFDIGFGIALMGETNIEKFFMETVTVDPHTAITSVHYQMAPQILPSLSPGSYYAIPVLQVRNGPQSPDLSGFVLVGEATDNVFKME